MLFPLSVRLNSAVLSSITVVGELVIEKVKTESVTSLFSSKDTTTGVVGSPSLSTMLITGCAKRVYCVQSVNNATYAECLILIFTSQCHLCFLTDPSRVQFVGMDR